MLGTDYLMPLTCRCLLLDLMHRMNTMMQLQYPQKIVLSDDNGIARTADNDRVKKKEKTHLLGKQMFQPLVQSIYQAKKESCYQTLNISIGFTVLQDQRSHTTSPKIKTDPFPYSSFFFSALLAL